MILQRAMRTEQEIWDDWDPEDRADALASHPPSDLIDFPTGASWHDQMTAVTQATNQ